MNGISNRCEVLLRKGLAALSLTLSEVQIRQLLDYLELLHKWNRAYNLTAIRDPEAMVERHLLDSLSVAKHIDGEQIADVGTGPGLPGMVLAIVYPQRHFTLMDSNGKKTRFLQQAKLELGLSNVEIYNGRVEAFPRQGEFDTIVSRAFASLADMLHWTNPLCAPSGCFMAMKGQYPEQELAELSPAYKLTQTIPLEVPGCDGQRHLLRLIRTTDSARTTENATE